MKADVSNDRSRLRGSAAFDGLSLCLILFGLYLFTASFFLAKRSLSDKFSQCDEASELLSYIGLSDTEIAQLHTQGIVHSHDENQPRKGCWLDRSVDSIIILLVDALRFDFAYYNLPESIGKRLRQSDHPNQNQTASSSNHQNHRSQLFQFVADPPTVTMQRLKALTTGGLPTFADISANFGGGTVDDDSWIQQLQTVDFRKRGFVLPSQTAFVGDDTWVDLFPHAFTYSYPYPSFNTRDLDTVDNGCLKHIPDLLPRVLLKPQTNTTTPSVEALIVHFLGVDHVGHTYGPHNQYMDAKLKQMDAALATILEWVDKPPNNNNNNATTATADNTPCHSVWIFGDHGMTEDGNHGGGSMEETHAALFVHSNCGGNNRQTSSWDKFERTESSAWVSETFAKIHQIDLVPTISLLLGLPIPFANLGALIPSALFGFDVQRMTASLALNAAQVWRYFAVYSNTANRLPDLHVLHGQLQIAVNEYKAAMKEHDDERYVSAATLFKAFLTEALELGHRVWTRFDHAGMITGILILAIGGVGWSLPIGKELFSRQSHKVSHLQLWETIWTVVFMIYQCGLLTFSNSYILEEDKSITYCVAVISIVLTVRMLSDQYPLWSGVLFVPIACRIHEFFISGHGLDPSIRIHAAHNAALFLCSLIMLFAIRWVLYNKAVTSSLFHAVADGVALICLAGSWWEKRDVDPARTGYFLCKIALVILFIGIPCSAIQGYVNIPPVGDKSTNAILIRTTILDSTLTVASKVLICIMAVTGPSTASSLVLYIGQIAALYFLSASLRGVASHTRVHSFVIAALLRLVTRHTFFATNHGCFFNRLQYSAAFVATEEFYFFTGGLSLFLNTFGWEMAGIVFAWLFSQQSGRQMIWRVYGLYQFLEAMTSCISVSLLRRHLMVWDIYAPHFLFVAIYTILHVLSHLTALLLNEITI
jgi:phosphatidylinositol glycan class O